MSMRIRQLIRHVFYIALVVKMGGGLASAGEVYITDFAKNGNLQSNLQSSFPTGVFTPSNSFGVDFDITSDKDGNNFAQLYGTNSSYTVNVGVYNATSVYTLMNAYSPPNGATLASVEFIGTGGADQTFTLINGTDTRDFFDGSFANTINNTTTKLAYSVVGSGGAGTGNVNTGDYGTYVIDEQKFVLSAAFADQTLTEVVYHYSGSGGTPILEGMTVVAGVPEPSTLVVSVMGVLLCLPGAMKRLRSGYGRIDS